MLVNPRALRKAVCISKSEKTIPECSFVVSSLITLLALLFKQHKGAVFVTSEATTLF